MEQWLLQILFIRPGYPGLVPVCSPRSLMSQLMATPARAAPSVLTCWGSMLQSVIQAMFLGKVLKGQARTVHLAFMGVQEFFVSFLPRVHQIYCLIVEESRGNPPSPLPISPSSFSNSSISCSHQNMQEGLPHFLLPPFTPSIDTGALWFWQYCVAAAQRSLQWSGAWPTAGRP